MGAILYFYFFIFLYVIVSLIEWISHFYIMHQNGIVKMIHDNIIKIDTNHIAHHLETRLDQSLVEDFKEEGLVFNIMKISAFILVLITVTSGYLFWLYFPNAKQCLSLPVIVLLSFVVSYGYFYYWNSIHTHYHKHYIEANKPLSKNPAITIYSIFPHFIPDETSYLYKYLLWYHTIHHLTKGEDKGNYNIICPLFDFIFGTYKSTVDNTKHFANHSPKTEREEWLKQHISFDIRVLDNNILEYKDKGTSVWNKLPSL